MARILVAYASTEGQTRKIAQHVADALSRNGKNVQVIDIRRPPTGFTVDGFDAIVIGASIHLGKHSRQLSEFVRRHIDRLNAVHSGFFSVSLSAAGSEKERADASRFVEELLTQAGWNPAVKVTIAGGLRYREYGFLKRWLMKKIARSAGKDTDTDRRKRVLLTMKEVNRLRVLQGYMDGKMLIEEAARILKRSLRSVYRMLAKVREKGPEESFTGTGTS